MLINFPTIPKGITNKLKIKKNIQKDFLSVFPEKSLHFFNPSIKYFILF
jgi:hypothetical protein